MIDRVHDQFPFPIAVTVSSPSAATKPPVDLSGLSDAGLRARFLEWRMERPLTPRGRVDPSAVGTALDFASEAIRRTHRVHLYEEQRDAAWAMTAGQLVELETGEGKTFVAAVAGVALLTAARSVHIITSNHYLATRDATLLAPAYELLGLRSAVLPIGGPPENKRLAYAADLLYATAPELGFDVLRDELIDKGRVPPRLGTDLIARLRGTASDTRTDRVAPSGRPDVAIVDEADHVLLDEATSPLILAGHSSEESPDAATLRSALSVAGDLLAGRDFLQDEATASIRLTEPGRRSIAEKAPATGVFLRPWADYITNALHAAKLLRLNEHYLIDGDEILLLDSGTGRKLPGHRWQAGLHLAVLAQAGLPLRADGGHLASMTRPRLFARYRRVVGMTGTASHAAAEFRTLYGLPVHIVAPHYASRRRLDPQRVFGSQDACLRAVANEICARHSHGQPVLVGTRTIETSDRVMAVLRERGVSAEVLTGRDDAREAEIIARAGQPSAITVATNLAGRGTDIQLTPESLGAGGLHVIALERQQSPRIDRQLIGRAARQGQPGSAQVFLAADDWLLTEYAPRLSRWIVDHVSEGGELPAELARTLDETIDAVQKRADGFLARRRQELFIADRAHAGQASSRSTNHD